MLAGGVDGAVGVLVVGVDEDGELGTLGLAPPAVGPLEGAGALVLPVDSVSCGTSAGSGELQPVSVRESSRVVMSSKASNGLYV